MTHDEAWEDIGFAADSLDNLIHAMALPMPADFHLRQLRVSLPVIRDRLRADFVAATGDNPWKTHGWPDAPDGAGEVADG